MLVAYNANESGARGAETRGRIWLKDLLLWWIFVGV